jgi:hypothetical protein
VADNAQPVESDERSPAIFGRVNAPPEPAERLPRQQVSDAGAERRRQFLVQQRLHRVDQPLADLQRHVSGEAVADDDVDVASVHVAAFDVAGKIDGCGLEQLVGVAGQIVSFTLFLSDRQQSDAWRTTAQRYPRVGGAHDRELDEMLRPAFDGRTGIEEHHGLPAGRDNRGERRAIDAGQTAKCADRRHHRRAGVTGAEDGGRGALSNRISGKPDRRTRLAPERDRCRLTHGNGLRRIQDFQIERAAARMPRELALDRRAIADQQQPDLKMAGRDQGSVNDCSRSLVAAHHIDGDSHHTKVLQGSTGFYKVLLGSFARHLQRTVQNP